MFLDSIICQVNTSVYFFCRKLLGSSPYVAFFIPEEFQALSDLQAQHEASYIEFSLFVEHWPYVLLKDITALLSFWRMDQDIIYYLLCVSKNPDSLPTVSKFSRFQYPDILKASQIFYSFLPVQTGYMICLRYLSERIHIYLPVKVDYVLVQQLFVGYLIIFWHVVMNDELVRVELSYFILCCQVFYPISHVLWFFLPFCEKQLTNLRNLPQNIGKGSLKNWCVFQLQHMCHLGFIIICQTINQILIYDMGSPNEIQLILFIFLLIFQLILGQNIPPVPPFEDLLDQKTIVSVLHSTPSNSMPCAINNLDPKGKSYQLSNLWIDLEVIKGDIFYGIQLLELLQTIGSLFYLKRILECLVLLCFVIVYCVQLSNTENPISQYTILSTRTLSLIFFFFTVYWHAAYVHNIALSWQLNNLELFCSLNDIKFVVMHFHKVVPESDHRFGL